MRSFNIFVPSQDLRKTTMALGHTLPKSITGIGYQVVKYGANVIENFQHDSLLKKATGERFNFRRIMRFKYRHHGIGSF